MVSWVLHEYGIAQGNLRQSFVCVRFPPPIRHFLLLPVEVEGLGIPRFHFGQLVTDDFYQHGWKLHFQSLRLSEGVETEFQQITNQLKCNRKGERSEISSVRNKLPKRKQLLEFN